MIIVPDETTSKLLEILAQDEEELGYRDKALAQALIEKSRLERRVDALKRAIELLEETEQEDKQ